MVNQTKAEWGGSIMPIDYVICIQPRLKCSMLVREEECVRKGKKNRAI